MTSTIRLCSIDDIPEGKSKGFYLAEGAFFAVKKNAQVFLYRNICPHLGTPLEWQEDTFLDMDGELIQCASHGALFVIESGQCVYGPCSGSALIAANFTVENNDLLLRTSK